MIDLLAVDPVDGIVVVDFISSERQFVWDLRFPHQDVFPTLTDPNHTLVSKALDEQICLIVLQHSKLMMEIVDSIAKPHPPNFISLFVEKITSIPQIFSAHENYMNDFVQHESMAAALSFEHSPAFVDQLDNRVLLQLMRAPITWQKQASALAQRLLSILPANFALRRRLEDFSRQAENLLETIDAIPKLELLAKRVMNCPFPITVSGRRILKKGMAKKHCRKDVAMREIILFSDIFIYGQCKGKQLWSIADYPLTQLRVELTDSDCPLLSFYTPKKSFVLEFRTVEERAAWNDALARAIPNAANSSDLSELGEIVAAPIWIPDKATKVCMVCKSPFTTVRRRHHCRSCGQICCSDCLPNRVAMPGISDKPVMCCNTCYRGLSARARK
jgi:hypothetical protein